MVALFKQNLDGSTDFQLCGLLLFIFFIFKNVSKGCLMLYACVVKAVLLDSWRFFVNSKDGGAEKTITQESSPPMIPDKD